MVFFASLQKNFLPDQAILVGKIILNPRTLLLLMKTAILDFKKTKLTYYESFSDSFKLIAIPYATSFAFNSLDKSFYILAPNFQNQNFLKDKSYEIHHFHRPFPSVMIFQILLDPLKKLIITQSLFSS